MTELMRRRRALMAVGGSSDPNILFEWKPSDGLAGIQIVGTAPSAYSFTANGINLYGGNQFAYTEIDIPGLTFNGSFTLVFVVDISKASDNAENFFSVRFVGINSRLNYNKYNNMNTLKITGIQDQMKNISAATEIKCVYDTNANAVHYYADNILLGTTSNPGTSTAKIACWYAPQVYSASSYLEIKQITVYKGVR